MNGHYNNQRSIDEESEWDVKNILFEKLAKKIFPQYFKDEYEFNDRECKMKFCEPDKIAIMQRFTPKNIFAEFQVRINFNKRFRYFPIEGWKEEFSMVTFFVDTPVLTVVSRETISKSPFDVREAMVKYFKANVLLVDSYIWEDFSHDAIKNTFKPKIILVFNDELK